MKVYTTETYLRNHLARLRQRLIEEFDADPVKVDTIDSYLTADEQKGLTQYAQRMHREWHMMSERAQQLVAYVDVPESKRHAAVEMLKNYLTMFVSVVAPGDTSSN